jgi:hypothetical protein
LPRKSVGSLSARPRLFSDPAVARGDPRYIAEDRYDKGALIISSQNSCRSLG